LRSRWLGSSPWTHGSWRSQCPSPYRIFRLQCHAHWSLRSVPVWQIGNQHRPYHLTDRYNNDSTRNIAKNKQHVWYVWGWLRIYICLY
jgi:hypothetical protein